MHMYITHTYIYVYIYTGGALLLQSTTANINDGVFEHNSATSSFGGAIKKTQDSSLYCNSCTFRYNSALDGGAIHLDGQVSLPSNTFLQNTAR